MIKVHLLKIVLEFHHVIDQKIEYFKFWLTFFSRLVPATRANDLVQVYDEKLRLLRKLKPDLFDSQGNLLSHNPVRSHSHTTTSAPSSKK